ncbi:spermidine/putrescine transport system substrate-binding protein [Paucidesulfovibrio gracilis DSM 16080]|uniref:Spermidine/putrescine transport system substrate-binding protein n=1 Tax=Paucidesulfovibrio gracilis DSM 16080 TaxID=1121449 RepID=A0A1T4WVC8_9BACT|nr:extracellular solute-binding protein [Paucidesulfovibrio gracilis]SKA80591.1 spermidine/putrescine transport system substrate-binding protein [Paucidesulfovibrio gracilis DSM 16080]
MRQCILSLLLVLLTGSAFAGGGEVYVYNWTEYIPDQVLSRFTKETGIKVVYTTYESNEAMYAKVKLLGGEGYDVVVPSTYFVNRMRNDGLLAPLDRSLLPNFSNVNPAILDKSYDPGNQYSVPYLWGGTGILVNADAVDPEKVSSWKGLWDEALKGRLLLQNDLREVFGIGLLLKGYSLNETDSEKIKEVYELLRTLVPSVRVFNSDSPKLAFLGEEVSGGMIWNGEAYVAMQEIDSLQFVWPQEGGIFWMDNFVIPKGARNIENAHAFINFMLRPDISAMCCEEYGYPTPIPAAQELLPEELRNSSVVFPPKEVMERSEFQDDVGDAILLYEEYWQKLKVSK